MQMMRSIDEGKYSPVPSHVREDVKNLIQMMLQTEPNKRPTVDQLLNSLCIQQHIVGRLAHQEGFEVNPSVDQPL